MSKIDSKISKKESLLSERIHFLKISLSLLEHGRRPFHNEAIKLIKNQIEKLKQS